MVVGSRDRTEAPVVKKPRKNTYNAGDLLDPITPQEQRLEAKLATKAKQYEEEDE